MNKEWIIKARWEVERVALIADLIRRGVLPSQRDIESADLAWQRLDNLLRQVQLDEQNAA